MDLQVLYQLLTTLFILQFTLVNCGAPVNTAVRENSTARMNCSWDYSYSTKWADGSNIPISYDASITSTLDPSRQSRYSIQGNPILKVFDLQISPVIASEDAGEYICEIFDGQENRYAYLHVQLIVLDGDISCNVSYDILGDSLGISDDTLVAGEQAIVSCSIGYAGAWAPDIFCTSSQFELRNTINATTNDENIVWNKSIFTIALTSQAGVVKTDITCGVAFIDNYIPDDYTDIRGINAYDRSMPVYTTSWTSQEIHILFPPQGVSIEPDLVRHLVGTSLTCSSNANPEATYAWRRVDTGAVLSSEAVFTVPEGFLTSDVITVECIATNTFRNIIYDARKEADIRAYIIISEDEVDVTAKPDETEDWWLYVLAALLVVVGLAIMIGLIVYCCKKKKKAKVGCSPKKSAESKYDHSSNGSLHYDLVQGREGIYYIDDYEDIKKARWELHTDHYDSGILETPPPAYDQVMALSRSVHSVSHI